MVSSNTGSRAGSADNAAVLKFEYDGDDDVRSQTTSRTGLTSQPAQLQPSSPLLSQASSSTPHYTTSYFTPARAGDDDVHMTDATDGTADVAVALKSERSPASNSGTTKKSKAGATSRGIASAKGRGGSRARGSSAAGTLRGGSGVSKKTSLLQNGGGKHAAVKRHTASPSPSVKREPSLAGPGDEDDGDNEEEEEEEVADEEEEGGGDGEDDASDNGPYCICRGPDDHRWMIQCDQCEDWFHGDCVKINKEEGENVILSYICPNCTIPGRYVTRFRKLCSLPNCRKPARLYADDGTSAASPADASYFCSDGHRDQWWDVLLARMDRGGGDAVSEDKMAVDQFTPAQLISILSYSNLPAVTQMLLHGLTQDSCINPDTLLTDEERETTKRSAADRYHLAEQVVMCKKMLQLLDMAKTRSQDAVKAGDIERDCCGYDDRLQHVGVQPHFERFLSSPEGVAVFRAEALAAPRFDDEGHPVAAENNDAADEKAPAPAADAAASSTTAGMCRKRKCKAHAGWFSTLARDVRMQMQEFTRQAAALRDNETRIRLAAAQRAFVKQHTVAEVRYVGDSDNSLSSLGGSGQYPSSGDEDDDDDNDEGDNGDNEMVDYESSIESNKGRTRNRPYAGSRSTGSQAQSPAYNGYGGSSRRSSREEADEGAKHNSGNGSGHNKSRTPGRDDGGNQDGYRLGGRNEHHLLNGKLRNGVRRGNR